MKYEIKYGKGSTAILPSHTYLYPTTAILVPYFTFFFGLKLNYIIIWKSTMCHELVKREMEPYAAYRACK